MAAAIGSSAAASIVLDADFDHGSLDEANSLASDTLVTLTGRDNYNPGLWKWLYFSATGVAGLQPTFRIDDDFATGGSDLNAHEMVYSYNQQDWLFFDNNVRQSSLDRFSFFNDQPFSQNQVYVAYGLPYPNLRVVNHVNQVNLSPWVSPTASASPNLVIGQSPGGIDDLGRNISHRDILGFKITDSSSSAPKAKVVLVGGVHANESLGNYTLEGMIDFLVGDSREAGLLRKQAEFYVYPMANPDGRHAGFNRSTVQHPSLDPNRYWTSPDYGGLDEVKVVGDAMIEDTISDADYLIDFHSDTAGKEGHYGYILPQWQGNPLWLNFLQLEPAIRTENAVLSDFTTAKFGRDELGADFSITFETQFLAGENVDRFLDLGRNWGLAFFRTLNVFADLDLDGALGVGDWMLFVGYAETNLSMFSPYDAYLHGDLDGDGRNSVNDFGLFKTAFEQTYGAGSFATMTAGVPEPTAVLLAVFAVCTLALSRTRCPRRATIDPRKTPLT